MSPWAPFSRKAEPPLETHWANAGTSKTGQRLLRLSGQNTWQILRQPSPGSASNMTPRKGCFTTAHELWLQVSGFQYLLGERSWGCHLTSVSLSLGFPGGAVAKNPRQGDARDMGVTPGWGGPLEKGVATHFSILAWKPPWTEKPGWLQSKGNAKSQTQRGTHTHKPQFAYVWHMVKNPPATEGGKRDPDSIPGSGRLPGGGNGNPLQYSCLEIPMDRGY